MKVKSFFSLSALPIVAMLLFACNELDIDKFKALPDNNGQVVSTHLKSREVTLNEARNIAYKFISYGSYPKTPPTKNVGIVSRMISSSEIIREENRDLMYVFNYKDGGFVIVCSSRDYYPILAFSDKGTFGLCDDMGPIDVWLDEIKICIRNSSSLDDKTKAQIRQLWARYEGTDIEMSPTEYILRRPQSRSAGEDACWSRCDSLQALYGSDGWTFCSLNLAEDAFANAGLSDYYDEVCYYAGQNHSALNETLIGYRVLYEYKSEGPLLNTEWDQMAPFDSLCRPYKPGCGAIAVAQAMKFFEWPESMHWDGIDFDWDDIPYDWSSNSEQARLVRMVGDYINMQYGTSGSWAVPDDVVTGLISLGYGAYQNAHNKIAVGDAVLVSHRPVIMVGNHLNLSILPYPANLVGGHYWVCDGAIRDISNQFQFYTENQPYGAGNFTQGQYSFNSPGIFGGTVTRYYHMNWGFDNEFYHHYNGWFLEEDVNQGVYNFQYSRRDIFLSPNNQ